MNEIEILKFKVAKLETYLNSFGGNSAHMKMKTVAVKRKLALAEAALAKALESQGE